MRRICPTCGFCLLALVSAAWIPPAPARAANIFYYTGSPNAYVSQGKTRTMTPAAGATFSGFRYFDQGAYTNSVSISVFDGVDNWQMAFVGPNLTLPTVGNYPQAQRWPFQEAGYAGLSWFGDGRGDNTLTGSFQVLDASYDAGGNLVSFAADFTQYDEGIASRMNFGQIRYNSDVPLPEPSVLLASAGFATAGLLIRRRRPRRH